MTQAADDDFGAVPVAHADDDFGAVPVDAGDSMLKTAGAGVKEGLIGQIADFVGAPINAIPRVANAGVSAFNQATGMNVPPIPEMPSPLGKYTSKELSKIGPDTSQIDPTNAHPIARAIGRGVGGAIAGLPVAGIEGGVAGVARSALTAPLIGGAIGGATEIAKEHAPAGYGPAIDVAANTLPLAAGMKGGLDKGAASSEVNPGIVKRMVDRYQSSKLPTVSDPEAQASLVRVAHDAQGVLSATPSSGGRPTTMTQALNSVGDTYNNRLRTIGKSLRGVIPDSDLDEYNDAIWQAGTHNNVLDTRPGTIFDRIASHPDLTPSDGKAIQDTMRDAQTASGQGLLNRQTTPLATLGGKIGAGVGGLAGALGGSSFGPLVELAAGGSGTGLGYKVGHGLGALGDRYFGTNSTTSTLAAQKAARALAASGVDPNSIPALSRPTNIGGDPTTGNMPDPIPVNTPIPATRGVQGAPAAGWPSGTSQWAQANPLPSRLVPDTASDVANGVAADRPGFSPRTAVKETAGAQPPPQDTGSDDEGKEIPAAMAPLVQPNLSGPGLTGGHKYLAQALTGIDPTSPSARGDINASAQLAEESKAVAPGYSAKVATGLPVDEKQLKAHAAWHNNALADAGIPGASGPNNDQNTPTLIDKGSRQAAFNASTYQSRVSQTAAQNPSRAGAVFTVGQTKTIAGKQAKATALTAQDPTLGPFFQAHEWLFQTGGK